MLQKGVKLSIVGIGKVGSTLAFGVLMKGLAEEMVLVGHSREKTEGEVLDLRHSVPFTSRMEITAGDYRDTAGSDIVVITASVSMNQNMKDRMELLKENYRLFQEIIPEIAAGSPEAIIIVITNPVDIMTYATLEISGFPPSHVLGTGTTIDSIRLRSVLAQAIGINPREMHAYILGEHGESQFPVASQISIAGLRELDQDTGSHLQEIFQRTKAAGFDIFHKKGYTNFAIAVATMAIIECIIHDQRIVYPVSTRLDDYYGISDVCISVPAVIGRKGVMEIFEIDLSEEEKRLLEKTASVVKDKMRPLGLGKSAAGVCP